MVERVAQQVGQRRLDLRENVAVHLGLLARHRQAGLLAQLPREVPHHARERLRAVGKWPHAHPARVAIQPRRKPRRRAVEAVQLLHARLQEPQALRRLSLRLLQRDPRALVRLRPEPLAQFFQRSRQLLLPALEPQQTAVEGFQPARLHQRFARQPEQAVEIVRRHPQHAVGAILGRGPRLRRRGRPG